MPSPKFHFFTGKLPADATPLLNPLLGLPSPPPWRRFVTTEAEFALDPSGVPNAEPTLREKALAEAYQIGEQSKIVNAVNAALLLRRPLMVTGPAGAGKSSLIYAIARELRLGPVLTWNITSRSTLREGQYDYDPLGRLQEIQIRQSPGYASNSPVPVADFLRLGPLGTALLPASWPKALLIDEIDKADLDLPNDLLNLFEEGKFTIEELRREASRGESQISPSNTWNVRTWRDYYGSVPIPANGEVACSVFPFILLTSNGEREFSAPFLRRCVRLQIEAPSDPVALARIITAHLKDVGIDVQKEAQDFLAKSRENQLSTDQLLNAIFVLEECRFAEESQKAEVLDILYQALAAK